MQLVLIHGAYMGAWVWDAIAPELDRLGHSVVAVDLPIGDSTAGGAAYARTVLDAVDWSVPTVLVAHSLGGLVAPLVAAERRVARIVFVAALLPAPGASVNDQRGRERIDAPTALVTAQFTDLGEGVWEIGADTATELFWHDAEPGIAAAAAARLRPQAYRAMTEVTPLTAWPSVDSAYIACRDDHATDPEWERSAARDRLGVAAVEIDGGHSPMITRPAELATLIDRLATGA